MNFIGPANITFEQQESGQLAARMGSERFGNVLCVPLFPLFDAHGYVSVQKKKEKENEEIGIIRNVGELPPDQQRLVLDDISFRYFMPEILHIVRIKSRQGMDRWTVTTDKGDKEFTVQDRKENVHMTERGVVFITDVDGCRYKIRDYRALQEKAKDELERVLL